MQKIFIALAALSLSCSCAVAQGSEEVIDRIIAIVGDEILLESEVYQNAQAVALQQGWNSTTNQDKFQSLLQEILQEMINQKILLAKAKEDTLTVEPREVDRELENRLQMMIQNAGSEQKIEEIYGYSIKRIRREFRPTVEEALLVEKLKSQHLRGISVTRAEVEQYFHDHPEAFPPMKDAVEIAHLLVEMSGAVSGEARAKARADSLYDAIKRGASFDSLALYFSDDKATASKYGRIGWTQEGDLLSVYEDAAKALKIGEVSRPVKTRIGYHIIRLEDRKDNQLLTSHILIIPKAQQEDEQTVIDSLKGIREKILAGLPFEDAVKQYSSDLESSSQGGKLGWFRLEDMPAEFRSAIDTLDVGEISNPFKSQYGFHIVKLLNRRSAREIRLDQDWEIVSQAALNAKREKEYKRWLNELKSRYYIEVKS
jgi:peptidyl-prolyl cis-trans isomerase SurA